MEIKYLFEGKSVALITERVWKNPGARIKKYGRLRKSAREFSLSRLGDFLRSTPTTHTRTIGIY